MCVCVPFGQAVASARTRKIPAEKANFFPERSTFVPTPDLEDVSLLGAGFFFPCELRRGDGGAAGLWGRSWQKGCWCIRRRVDDLRLIVY